MIQKENFQVILFSTVPASNDTQKIYGIHRMSTELRKKGHTCQVVHFYTHFTNDELTTLVNTLVGTKTLVIGFSSTFFSWGSDHDKELILQKINHIIDYTKLKNKNVKIIIGGASPFSLAKYKKNSIKHIDAIFDGFPEYNVCKYVNALSIGESLPEPTKINASGTNVYKQSDTDENFDFSKSQTIYAPEDYIDENEAVVIEIGRGCIFKCKFCTFRLNGKKKLDYIKDPDVLREELIRNYNDYKIQYYILSDDTFNDSSEKIKNIHAVFTSLPFKIKFSAYLRLDLLYHNREQVQLLKEMGLTGAMFGVESFNDAAARAVGKGLGGKRAKQFLEDLKNEYWGEDVKIEVALITGLPGETTQSYEETKLWIIDQTKNIDLVRVNALRMQDPATVTNPNILSIFAKNANIYGYYWKEDPNHWYNDSSDVKDYSEAMNLQKILDNAARENLKFAHGGFTLFGLWNTLQHMESINISFDDLVRMNRIEFSQWTYKFIASNREKMKQHYLEHYKRNFGL